MEVDGQRQAVQNVGALLGFAFKTLDGLNVAQFRSDGFTFNRLRPYTRWEDILPRALELWRVYVDVLDPTVITRVAVRYINHLVLPEPTPDLSRYLTAPPAVSPDIPHHLAGFLVRLVLQVPTTGIAVQVTQASEQSLQPGHATVILDIDAYKAADYDVKDGARVTAVLAELREVKNQVFFGSVTEEAARLYE